MSAMGTIRATAPAKAILLGEHAVNRGQSALAVSVGLYATCTLTCPSSDSGYSLATEGGQRQETTRSALLELAARIDAYRAANDYVALQQLAAEDYFAPAKYVMAALGEALPPALMLHFASQIPPSAGLGSGGAIFSALSAALAHLLRHVQANDITDTRRRIASWAVRGDIIAHGGVASGLDSQTSLYGGAIRYSAEHQSEPVACAPGLQLVIGDTHVFAATSAVNGRVRTWLAERSSRLHYFQEIGLLARQAELALATGNWHELGHLLNLNQLILERIGVSCPQLEMLNEAALEAGALGAKLSGSGGGGIMIALTPAEKVPAVSQAIEQAGGTAIVAPIGVAGVQVQ